MAEASVRATFPRWLLIGIGALLIATVGFVALARLTGFGITKVNETPILGSVDIWFEDQDNKTMLVRRFADNAVLEVLPADGGGFIRGVVRSLFRQRLVANQERTLPFRLSQRQDQKFFILDMSTGAKMELDGFGPSNTLSIARVLEAGLKKEGVEGSSKSPTPDKAPTN
jgi:putative photosynthetic complex assembly protein